MGMPVKKAPEKILNTSRKGTRQDQLHLLEGQKKGKVRIRIVQVDRKERSSERGKKKLSLKN